MAAKGIAVKPDSSVILSLSPSARTALYALLAPDPRNPQCEPFPHWPEPGEDWFADTGIAEETLAASRRLIYRPLGIEAFVDGSVMLPYLKSNTDRGALFRGLSSQS